MPPRHELSLDIDGKTIRFESGRLARQADGAVLLRQGDTVLLATVVGAPEPKPGAAFFPLTVEYRERAAAGGRIPGAYGKREGRISDHEVLASRLADRTIRPLFAEGFKNDTQVFLTVLSADEEVEPESFAILAAAAALAVSDLPFDGPIAGVRVAHGPFGWALFPSRAQRAQADLDLVVSAGPCGMAMVEGQANEADESLVVEALSRADEACRRLCEVLVDLRDKAGRERRPFEAPAPDAELASLVEEKCLGPLAESLRSASSKDERREAIRAPREALMTALAESHEGREAEISEAYGALVKRTVRGRILEDSVRPDGRGLEDIRDIWSEVGWLPRCHGSAVFTRGETQALVSCTLGTGQDELRYDTLEGRASERFILHYNFPPYSTGEVRPARGPGRREIGHGNLAHRALAPLLPDTEGFPYTVRLVSDISESNGSSSMATVCGGCLALMDAGVPLRRPVAGIAMGLIASEGVYRVLSDILGDEDHLGDMDFKVAGTTEGITAIQMDNKLGSIPPEVLEGALDQARRGRLHILEKMGESLEASRSELSPRAPRVVSMRIRPSRIRDLIGPGGRHVQEIRAATGAEIDVDDDGLVRIYTADQAAAAEAIRRARHLTLEPEVGKVYEGEVILVRDFFAIVKLGATIEGRLHVSQLDERRVAKVQDVLSKGDRVPVRVMGVDDKGKIELSRRAVRGEEPVG